MTNSYGATEFPGISSNGEVAGDIDLKLMPVTRESENRETGRLETVALYSPADTPHPRGEIVVRRKDGTTAGYFENPEATASNFKDGWYYTGDVGQLNFQTLSSSGQPLLTIIDRVKSLEEIYWAGDSVWIESVKLELEIYGNIPEVESIVLAADRNRPGLLAIVVLTPDFLSEWEAQNGVPGGSIKDLQVGHDRGSAERVAQLPTALVSRVLQLVRQSGKEAKRKEWELPIGVVVDTERWTEVERIGDDLGLLTLTGKVKRGLVKKIYNPAVNHVYGSLGSEQAESAHTSEVEVSGQCDKSRLNASSRERVGGGCPLKAPSCFQTATGAGTAQLKTEATKLLAAFLSELKEESFSTAQVWSQIHV